MPKTVVIRGISNRALFERIRTALHEKFEGTDTLTVSGTPRTVASLIADLDRAEARFKEVEVAQAHVRSVIDVRNGELVLHNQLAKDIVGTLEVQWGRDSAQLAASGIPPRKKRRTLTSVEKFAATVKRNRTRKMRGTRGRRQAAAIKAQGVVRVEGAMASDPSAPEA